MKKPIPKKLEDWLDTESWLGAPRSLWVGIAFALGTAIVLFIGKLI